MFAGTDLSYEVILAADDASGRTIAGRSGMYEATRTAILDAVTNQA